MTYIPKFGSENLVYNFFFFFFHPKESCTLFEILIFLLNYDLFCLNWSYQGPYHFSSFISSFLYDPAYKAWLFKKFIFELEAYYSFKTTSILVRQELSLRKNGDFIGKIYCLISWSPICTHLILVLASMKMTGTSAITV